MVKHLATRVSKWCAEAISAVRRLNLTFLALGIATGVTASAQTDPWSNAATKMGTIFSGPIAKGFALVALDVGGLELAFGEGGSRRNVGGLIFGLGLALGAANFIEGFGS